VRGLLAPPQAADELGWLGPYRVLAVLGEGGMGVVFEAEDPQLERRVALKVMRPGQAGEVGRRRFLREARATAAIEHDHIVPIFQVGEAPVEGVGVVPFLAMPFLRGETLEARLERDRNLPAGELLRVGRELALGLAAAHEKGLIHRDLKPANVWLEAKTDRVKILDFGLARATHEGPVPGPQDTAAQGPATRAPDAGAGLTEQGALVGTPAYMAPEQVKGQPVDQRCDLFGLGCVLYQMSTGELPFKGADTLATLTAVVRERPRLPRDLRPELPAELSWLVMRLLAKSPAGRPPSAAAVAEELDGIRQRLQRRARRRRLAVVAGAALLALAPNGFSGHNCKE
jgi:serine/threonine protein kinase